MTSSPQLPAEVVDGDHYEGSFSSGVRSGHGHCRYADGSTYTHVISRWTRDRGLPRLPLGKGFQKLARGVCAVGAILTDLDRPTLLRFRAKVRGAVAARPAARPRSAQALEPAGGGHGAVRARPAAWSLARARSLLLMEWRNYRERRVEVASICVLPFLVWV